jgi:metal-sulfur cluster biosynthetic enzyme
MDTKSVMTVLRRVMDPEQPVSVVDMGVVKAEDVKVTKDEVRVEFTPTSPYCPMGAVIGILIRKALEDALPGKHVIVKVKAGTHLREDACNAMIMDDAQYKSAVDRLAAQGALDRLIAKR